MLITLTFYGITLDVIDKIKNNPDEQQIILSAWDPSDFKPIALLPCHRLVQVSNKEIHLSFLYFLEYKIRLSVYIYIYIFYWSSMLPTGVIMSL